MVSDENYAIAIKILTEHFSRRDLLINERVNNLLVLCLVKSSTGVDKLRLLYDKAQFLVYALSGFGVTPEEYNVVLNMLEQQR